MKVLGSLRPGHLLASVASFTLTSFVSVGRAFGTFSLWKVLGAVSFARVLGDRRLAERQLFEPFCVLAFWVDYYLRASSVRIDLVQ